MPRICAQNNAIEVTLIGNNIRCLRQMRNIKAEELARMLGLSKASYSEIENDKVKIKLERLQQIADILNVHYTQVINFNPDHLLVRKEVDIVVPEKPVQPFSADLAHSFIRQLEIKDQQIQFLQEQLVSYKQLLWEHISGLQPQQKYAVGA